jgi:ABC-type sugar transport system substrate-binding protein
MAGTPRVLVSLFDETQEYQKLQGEAARAVAARSGVEVEVVYGNRDPATQARQIEQALHVPEDRRPAAVVVQPMSVAVLEPTARGALQAGIGWVSLDPAIYLESLQRANPGKLVAVLTADGRAMGTLQARISCALLPRGGGLVYVEGPPLAPAVIDRREGMMEGLRGSGIRVTKTLHGDWSEASGARAAELWLRLGRVPRPDLIAAQNDAMAAGVRKAIETWKAEWVDVPITGCDGLPEGGQRMVREGVLAATVIQPITAAPAVELAARALRGERVEPSTRLAPSAFPPIEELKLRMRG